MKLVYMQSIAAGIVVVLVLSFKIWLFGSAITSAVKSISDSCGKQYGIESLPLISGNWFCSENEDEMSEH